MEAVLLERVSFRISPLLLKQMHLRRSVGALARPSLTESVQPSSPSYKCGNALVGTYHSPEYRARTLSIKALVFTVTASSSNPVPKVCARRAPKSTLVDILKQYSPRSLVIQCSVRKRDLGERRLANSDDSLVLLVT